MPLKKIDDHEFAGIPDGIKKLMRAYKEFLKQSGGKFSESVF